MTFPTKERIAAAELSLRMWITGPAHEKRPDLSFLESEWLEKQLERKVRETIIKEKLNPPKKKR